MLKFQLTLNQWLFEFERPVAKLVEVGPTPPVVIADITGVLPVVAAIVVVSPVTLVTPLAGIDVQLPESPSKYCPDAPPEGT